MLTNINAFEKVKRYDIHGATILQTWQRIVRSNLINGKKREKHKVD